MKRILMRAAMSPFDNFSVQHTIMHNTIGTNSGNLIFQYSVCKTLMTGHDTVIDTLNTGRPYFTEDEIAAINENYDLFVIPLANAFRFRYQTELECLAGLVNGLKIPCVVIGVGLEAPLHAKKADKYPFDAAAKHFIKSVLNKSAMIGLRGEMTADYLSNLGFQAQRDFTVIGCPSMFMFGNALPPLREKKPLTRESMICYNHKPGSPKNYLSFIDRCRDELPNHYFIAQVMNDLNLLYAGVPWPGKKPDTKGGYPYSISHELLIQNRVRMFTNVPSWLAFLGQAQLSFGRRIHGSIAAVLAGTPSFIFAPDARVFELAQYHNIPHMLMKGVTRKTSIIELYETTDFTVMHQQHNKKFEHYSAFLSKNGLEHVYDGKRNYDTLPFDEKIASIDFRGSVGSVYKKKPQILAQRLEFGYAQLSETNARLEQALATTNLMQTIRRLLINLYKKHRKP